MTVVIVIVIESIQRAHTSVEADHTMHLLVDIVYYLIHVCGATLQLQICISMHMLVRTYSAELIRGKKVPISGSRLPQKCV